MLFVNGLYRGTSDDGKTEVTGYNQQIEVDKDGNQKLTGGTSFTFNDLDLDRAALKSGEMRVTFMSAKTVEAAIKQSGVEDQSALSRWGYTLNESTAGKMDYKTTGPQYGLNWVPVGQMTVINGVGYNDADAGNYLWGYAMGKMGYLSITARLAGHVNAWWDAKRVNGQESGYKSGYGGFWGKTLDRTVQWFENRSWGGDAAADQRAIQNGLNDSGSYWKYKWRTLKKIFQ